LIERSEKFVFFQRTDDRVPLLLRVGIAGVFKIEEQLQIYVGDAGIIFCALDVATHPEKGISDPTKHMGGNGVVE
jgi:hypothetical protein